MRKLLKAGIFLTIGLPLCFLVFIGCGGGGGGGNPIFEASPPRITGSITASGAIQSIRTIRPAIGGSDLSGIEVYVESNRALYNTRTSSDGRYQLENVQPGSHFIVAQIKVSEKVYKVRTGEITVRSGQSETIVNSAELLSACRQVRGVLLNSKNQPIPNARLTLWGETFSTDSKGEFITPLMPDGVDSEIKFAEQYGYQSTDIPVFFIGTDSAYIESVVSLATETNRAPKVNIQVSRTRVSANEAISLTGKAVDPDGDSLEFSWETTVGKLASESPDNLTVGWTAPNFSDVATITFEARETKSGGFVGRAKQAITIGSGRDLSNATPVVSLISPVDGSIFNLGTQVTFQATAEDQFEGVLPDSNFNWYDGSILIASGVKQFTKTFTDQMADPGIHRITVSATNSRGGGKTVSIVMHILPNSSSTLKIVLPETSWSTFPEGTPISLFGGAIDVEDGVISNPALLGWSFSLNGAVPPSFLGSGAAITANLSPGTSTVYFSAIDSYGNLGSTSVTVYMNRRPIMDFSPASDTVSIEKYPFAFDAAPSADPDGGNIRSEDLRWYLDGSLFNSGVQSFSIATLSVGNHFVTLVGSDNFGVVGTVTKRITINTNPPPVMNFSWASNSVFFSGKNVAFAGSGSDPDSGLAIPGGSMTWYLDDALWKSGVSGFSDSSLGIGSHKIRIQGLDKNGFSGSTSKFVSVIGNVGIVFPASGAIFGAGSPISVNGSPDSKGDAIMTWMVDGSPAVTGATQTVGPLNAGNYIITYLGTDSAANVSSASIGLTIKGIATITLSPVNVQYATEAGNIPVYLVAAGGGAVYFVATASYVGGGDAPGQFMGWYLDGSSFSIATGTAFGSSLSPGTHTLTVKLYDRSQEVSTTFQVWTSRIWGSFGSGGGEFAFQANDMDIDPVNGNFIFLADTKNDRVVKLTPDGGFLSSIGTTGTGDNQFNNPQGIAVSPDSAYIYVSDGGNNRVQKFSVNGAFVTKWGSIGTDTGQFKSPMGIAVSPDGNSVFVADLENNRIQEFSPTGVFISSWGSGPADLDGFFDKPSYLSMAGDGSFLFVTDCANSRIQKFLPNGTFVSKFGTYGSLDGEFVAPKGSALSPDRSFLYVTEYCNNRISKLALDGTFLSKWGEFGWEMGQFDYPVKVVASPDGTYFCVLDSANTRVHKITFRTLP